MSKFNYVTGYLPDVIDEKTQGKQIKQRVIISISAIAVGLFLFSSLKNDTTAQINDSVSSFNSLKLTENNSEKRINLKSKPQTIAANQTNKKLMTFPSTAPDKQLEKTYQKEIDNILSKAFAK